MGAFLYYLSMFIGCLGFLVFLFGFVLLDNDARSNIVSFLGRFRFFNYFVSTGKEFGFFKLCFFTFIVFCIVGSILVQLPVVRSYQDSVVKLESTKELDVRLESFSKEISLPVVVIKTWLPVLTELGFDFNKDVLFESKLSDSNFKVYSIGHSASVGKQIYHLYVDNANKILCVVYKDFYLYKDGKVISSIDCFDLNAFTSLELLTKEVVSSCLKSPTSAVFSEFYEWTWDVNPFYITVLGRVDAKNSFGVMLRSDFKVVFKKEFLNKATVDSHYLRIYLDGKLVVNYGDDVVPAVGYFKKDDLKKFVTSNDSNFSAKSVSALDTSVDPKGFKASESERRSASNRIRALLSNFAKVKHENGKTTYQFTSPVVFKNKGKSNDILSVITYITVADNTGLIDGHVMFIVFRDVVDFNYWDKIVYFSGDNVLYTINIPQWESSHKALSLSANIPDVRRAHLSNHNFAGNIYPMTEFFNVVKGTDTSLYFFNGNDVVTYFNLDNGVSSHFQQMSEITSLMKNVLKRNDGQAYLL